MLHWEWGLPVTVQLSALIVLHPASVPGKPGVQSVTLTKRCNPRAARTREKEKQGKEAGKANTSCFYELAQPSKERELIAWSCG